MSNDTINENQIIGDEIVGVTLNSLPFFSIKYRELRYKVKQKKIHTQYRLKLRGLVTVEIKPKEVMIA